MRGIGKRMAPSLFAVLLAASLAFGVTSAFAQVERSARAGSFCDDDGGISAGECTPLCDQKCWDRFRTGGDCIGGPTGYCCVCRI